MSIEEENNLIDFILNKSFSGVTCRGDIESLDNIFMTEYKPQSISGERLKLAYIKKRGEYNYV
jgi:hypothetical protein